MAATGPLTPGNTYIWVYTIAGSGGAADTIRTAVRPEGGYAGTFSGKMTGLFNFSFSRDDTQSAYYRILGDLSP